MRSALFVLSIAGMAVIADLGCRQPQERASSSSSSSSSSSFSTDENLKIEGLRAAFPGVLNGGAGLQLVKGDLAIGEATHVRLIDGGLKRTSVWRATRYGVEDFVAIDSEAEDVGSIDYVMTLADWTAGLRLVDRTLELLDRNGVPRLRMMAPYLVDRLDRVRDVEVAVTGCAVDTNPLPPFGRTIQAPGESQCILHVSWQRSGLVYPLLVDPGWSKTTSMGTARYRHLSHKLPNGDVLAIGGLTFVADKEVATSACEIYSVANGVWTTTASMMVPRAYSVDAPLPNGDVFVSGGLDQTLDGQTIHSTAEVYSVATGMWSKTTGNLITPRAGHSAGVLADGSVLLAAGFDNSGDHFETTEIFMPATSSFVSAGLINNTRYYQASVILGNGKMLLSGGSDPQAGPLPTLELYTPGVGWAAAADLPTITKRQFHAMVLLSNGDALIAGGINNTDGELASAEIYHAATNTIEKLPDTNTLTRARYELVGVSLPNGKALFLGGGSLMGNHYADGELYDPAAQPSNFLRVRGMSDERAVGHKATTLNDGRVLVHGGHDPHLNRSLFSADVFDINADAGPYLPDDEEREAGAPDAANPHGNIEAGCVWPCAADGKPSGDASNAHDATPTDLSTNPESTDQNAFSPLTGGGSGCTVISSASDTSSDRNAVLMLGSFATALWLFARRRRRH